MKTCVCSPRHSHKGLAEQSVGLDIYTSVRWHPAFYDMIGLTTIDIRHVGLMLVTCRGYSVQLGVIYMNPKCIHELYGHMNLGGIRQGSSWRINTKYIICVTIRLNYMFNHIHHYKFDWEHKWKGIRNPFQRKRNLHFVT